MKQDLASKIKADLRQVASKDKAKILARFFKTGRGEYGEGDKFLGVVVPEQRRIAKEWLRGFTSACPQCFATQGRRGSLEEKPQAVRSLNTRLVVRSRFSRSQMRLRTTLDELQKLLQSPFHEERLTVLLILIELYKKGDKENKKQIFNFYINNIKNINNWDLVDLSAPNIVGDYLLNFYLNGKEVNKFLLKLARSKNLWSRRVAVLATFPFIKNNKFAEILALTKFLLFKQKEKHDLMHKALGWMLREVGKRDKKVLINFLDESGARLPRVTLRYAIEKFPEKERREYLTLRYCSE